jgi:hypothetical protein
VYQTSSISKLTPLGGEMTREIIYAMHGMIHPTEMCIFLYFASFVTLNNDYQHQSYK